MDNREDIDAADDPSFIQSRANPNLDEVEFQLLDAPLDLSTLTDISVRFRASKTGDATASLKVEVRGADDTL